MSSQLPRSEIRDMLWKMIKHKSKFQVYNMFEMYGRLSLTELAEKLHKSKSTIHSHLQFLLKLGFIEKNRVPLDSNPNVFENYYELTANYEEIFKNINFDFEPFTKITKEDAEFLIEPAISITKMMKSYFDTQLEYYEALRDSNFDDDALLALNSSLQWVKGKEGKNVLLSRSTNSFTFFNEKDFFRQKDKDFQSNLTDTVDLDNLDFIKENSETIGGLNKPMLIIKSTIPYGYMIEYLNKQKKKCYQSGCKVDEDKIKAE